MANYKELVWDAVGEKFYETGVEQTVFYPLNPSNNKYDSGFAWNGVTEINEQPSGGDLSDVYADDTKYITLVAAEKFGATLNAYTYPDEFEECNGFGAPIDGVKIGQQKRNTFGLSYITKVGNDVLNDEYDKKLHLIWGCLATPTSKSYKTTNENPEAAPFSWTLNTTPATAISGYRPTSTMTIEKKKLPSAKQINFDTLMSYLHGSANVCDPWLPSPAEVIEILNGTFELPTPSQPGQV